MKIRSRALAACALSACALAMPLVAGAQTVRTREAQQQSVTPDTSRPAVGPAIQRIATASAVSTEPLGGVTGVRELRDGRLLVNDGQRRRLVLMDTTLKVTGVVLDSLTDVANAYGTRAGMLIPFRGDTTLFIDPASYAILMLDKNGRIARVRSVWRVQDLNWLMQTQLGVPGVDGRGRIVYRIAAQPAPPKIAPPAGVPYFPVDPDSAFIVAVNLDTRRIDTLGSIRTPKSETRIRQTADNGFMFDNIINPLPRTDDWAVLPDGRVAFVRGQDYRIEYLQPDATWKSSEKLPYEWQRLLDDDKKKLVDSVRTLQSRNVETQYVTQVIRWVNMYNGKYPDGLKIPSGYVPGPGFPKDWLLPSGVKFPENYIYACAPGQEPPPGMQVQSFNGPPPGMTIPTGGGTMVTSGGGNVRMGGTTSIDMSGPPGGAPGATPGATGAPGAGRATGAVNCLPAPVQFSTGGFVPPPPTMRPVLVVPSDELPDYKPPFNTGAVRADEDGNLWIRTVPPKPTPGGGVYDIIDSKGELVTRYQMPAGYTIVGFGKGKVVYATMRDATGIHLARIRLK